MKRAGPRTEKSIDPDDEQSPGADDRRSPPLRHLAEVPGAARRRGLCALLAEDGYLAVTDLARRIGVSEMTIRRDLDVLERQGLVERSHGGAVPASRPLPHEPLFATRRLLHAEAKAAIADAAVGLIEPNDIVGLDIGSTVVALAELLCERSDLRVVTNSLPAALALSGGGAPGPAVYLLGGALRAGEGSLCGPIARRQLAEHRLRCAFISVAAMSVDGLFDYAPEEAELKQAMMACAGAVVLLCDSSKFDRSCFVRVSGLDSINTVVCEAPPPPRLDNALTRAGVRVLVATPTMTFFRPPGYPGGDQRPGNEA